MHLLTALQEYGLSEKEAIVYLRNLELGSAPASVIARRAKLKRVTTYAILQDLVKKNCMKVIKKRGVQSFYVVEPEMLLVQKKQECKYFESLLPAFASVSDKWGNRPKIEYFEGLQGIKDLYANTIEHAREICAFLDDGDIHPEVKKYLRNVHVLQRIDAGIFAKVIISGSDVNQDYVSMNDDKCLRKTKIINQKFLNISGEVMIYGEDKVSFSMYNTEEMSGIIITSQQVYKTMQGIFDFLRMTHE